MAGDVDLTTDISPEQARRSQKEWQYRHGRDTLQEEPSSSALAAVVEAVTSVAGGSPVENEI